jgi:hypothetical protein
MFFRRCKASKKEPLPSLEGRETLEDVMYRYGDHTPRNT